MQACRHTARFFTLAILTALSLFSAAHGAARHGKANLAISAAMAPDGMLWLVGVNENGELYTQISPDIGKSWETPHVLDIGMDSVAADGENRPKIAFGSGQQVVISYTHPLAKPYTGEIRLLRSTDGGKTFGGPSTVHQDRQIITHRFDAILFDKQGRLHTVWVDKRDAALAASKGQYRGAAIYRNVSADGGQTFGPDIKVAEHSCECCRIALASSASGDVAALWRHVYAPNIRDHAFANLSLSSAMVRATQDNWQLDACPHHGPGLAAASDGGWHSVWFGERAGNMAVRYGRLNAGGEPIGDVRELPDANAEHADIASVGSKVAIAWRSFEAGQTHLRAWLSSDDGAHFTLRELAASAVDNDHPRLFTTAQGIYVLWKTAKETQTHALLP